MPTNEASGNPYEVYRPTIVATVHATVVKVRETSTSFNWSLGKVITECAQACNIPLQGTPEQFKRIVKFEFDKLKDVVANKDGYELIRSRKDFVLKDGQMKARLTNISLALVSLEVQLQEARSAHSRLGFKLTDASLNAEKRATVRKKMMSFVVIMDHVCAEMSRQEKLKAEAEILAKAESESAQANLEAEKLNLELAKAESL